MSGCVLKLGGSVITFKTSSVPRLRRQVLERIARQIAAVPKDRRPLVLVHGAGSFGHAIVARTKIHKAISGARSLRAWAETQILQNELNARVCRAFLNAGIPAFPYQPSSAGWTEDGALARLATEPLKLMVDSGLIPVLYGVPAADSWGGCRILSGDVLAPAVARALGAEWVIHGTDVNGVYTEDPRQNPNAAPIGSISKKNWDQVRLGLSGSKSVDVTGGMAAKAAALVEWARKGIRSRIVDAASGNHLKRALLGQSVGTEIRW